MFYKKSCSQEFSIVPRKTPVLVSLLNKLQVFGSSPPVLKNSSERLLLKSFHTYSQHHLRIQLNDRNALNACNYSLYLLIDAS